MRVCVYECICAGGLGGDVPASLLREGRAMRDAVVEDLRRVADVVTVDDEATFDRLAAACDWTLVIAPEFDDLLLSRARRVLEVGGRLLSPLPDAIALTADKLALADYWRERGVAHPWTGLFGRDQPTEAPWVFKPRHGAGSQETYLVRDHTLPDGRGSYGDFLVQQYVPGQPASVALLMGQRQTIPLMPARQHLSDDGRFRYEGGSLPLPKPLAERAARLALQAVANIDGLRGYVGVDLVLGDDGRDFAIEINPRLTTSYLGLRQLCEQNLAELMLRMAGGAEIETPAWGAGEVVFSAPLSR